MAERVTSGGRVGVVDRTVFWVWDRIATNVAVPGRSLGVFRWIFGLYLLLFDARWFAWLDRTPDAFFDPPILSISYLVGGFPPPPFFTGVDLVGLLALCLMTCGWRTRAMTIVAVVTYVISTTFTYSHGKISHQIAIVLVLTAMAVADWGKASPRRVAQAMSLLAVAICFGFLTAGFDKARYWINADMGVSGILSWYYPRMDDDGPKLLAVFVPGTPLPLLKAMDFAAVVVEVGGFIALLAGRIAWRVWLLMLPGLHLFNVLILNITFPTQAIGYLVFVNLLLIGSRRWTATAWLRIRYVLGGVAVLVTAWHVVTRVMGEGSFVFLGSGPSSLVTVDLAVGIGACIVSGVLIAIDLWSEVKRWWRSRAYSSTERSMTPG